MTLIAKTRVESLPLTDLTANPLSFRGPPGLATPYSTPYKNSSNIQTACSCALLVARSNSPFVPHVSTLQSAIILVAFLPDAGQLLQLADGTSLFMREGISYPIICSLYSLGRKPH